MGSVIYQISLDIYHWQVATWTKSLRVIFLHHTDIKNRSLLLRGLHFPGDKSNVDIFLVKTVKKMFNKNLTLSVPHIVTARYSVL